MSQPPRDAPPEPPLFHALRRDVGQVLDDVRKQGLWEVIRRTFDDLERFYLTEHTRRRLAGVPAIARVWQSFWLLIGGLFMKLTPVRRLLLALGAVLWLLGDQRIDLFSVHMRFNFRLAGDLLGVLVLMLELKDKLVARDELQAGRAVQLALMPQRHPEIRGWDVSMYTEPANDVGGDLVDHLSIDDTHHAVALGDVAGKALPAALLMVKLQATLRALVPQFSTLSDLGAGVNRILVRDGLPSRFATLVYLVLTADSGVVRVLNAGHPPPLVARRGEVTEMPGGSVVLGIIPDAVFGEQTVDLEPGDTLVAYSDGVTEANNRGGDFFGEDRLKAAVREAADAPASAIAERVLAVLADFVGDAPPHDDVSIVVVKRAAS
jgi:hypothetical protein